MVRVQESAYRSWSVQESQGTGLYSIVTTRELEEELALERLGTMPLVRAMVPFNSLLVPQRLEGDEEMAAVCRDLLAHTMVRLRREGNRIVLHVHDEVRCTVPAGAVEHLTPVFQKIMTEVPAWAKDFPLACDVESTTRYGK